MQQNTATVLQLQGHGGRGGEGEGQGGEGRGGGEEGRGDVVVAVQ